MIKVYIIYVKADKFELVFAFLNEVDADYCLKSWGENGIKRVVDIKV